MTEHEHDATPTANFVDAEDAKDFEAEHEQVVESEQPEKVSPENLGDNLVKVATEAAYAALCSSTHSASAKASVTANFACPVSFAIASLRQCF